MSWTGQPEPKPQALDRDQLIGAWNKAKDNLEAAKVEEQRLRELLFSAAFPKPKKGTNNLPLNNGWKLTCQFPQTRTLFVPDSFVPSDGSTVDKLDVADHLTEKMRRASNEGPLIAERLFKWSVSISETEYNLLPPNFKEMVDEFIVTTDGKPQMKLVPPKG